MNDRMQTGRENAPDRTRPGAQHNDESAPNGRRESSGAERSMGDRSSAARPALTDRERTERWPLG